MPVSQRIASQQSLPWIIFLAMSGWQLYMQGVFSDPDTGWHLLAGEWIATHGKLPLSDPWSFTAGDAPWYNLAWGFDLLLYGLYTLGGLPLIYFLTIFSYSLIAMLLAKEALNRGSGPIVLIGFFVLVAGPLLAQSALCRPQIISAFLFYACIHIFSRDREKPSPKLLALLPLMMVLWVNMHGGFILMAVLFAVHLVDALAIDDWARIRRLLVAGCFTALAILVNPYGYHIYDAVMRTMDSVMTRYIMEWRGVNFSVHWWFDMAILAFILGLKPTDRNLPLAEKALVLALLLLSLHSARHGLMLAIAATPYLTANLTQVLYALNNGEHHQSQDRRFQQILADKRVRMTALGCVGLLLFLAVVPSTRNLIAPHADELKAGKTSEKALAYIREHYPHSMRWMNEYGLGGSLLFYGKGKFPVFIDGRAGTAYSEKLLKDYLRIMETNVYGTKARALLRRYEVDGLIMPTGHRVNVHLKRNPLWKRVYKDAFVSLYVRKLKTD